MRGLHLALPCRARSRARPRRGGCRWSSPTGRRVRLVEHHEALAAAAGGRAPCPWRERPTTALPSTGGGRTGEVDPPGVTSGRGADAVGAGSSSASGGGGSSSSAGGVLRSIARIRWFFASATSSCVYPGCWPRCPAASRTGPGAGRRESSEKPLRARAGDGLDDAAGGHPADAVIVLDTATRKPPSARGTSPAGPSSFAVVAGMPSALEAPPPATVVIVPKASTLRTTSLVVVGEEETAAGRGARRRRGCRSARRSRGRHRRCTRRCRCRDDGRCTERVDLADHVVVGVRDEEAAAGERRDGTGLVQSPRPRPGADHAARRDLANAVVLGVRDQEAAVRTAPQRRSASRDRPGSPGRRPRQTRRRRCLRPW